jgi:hypothetical protein
MAFLNADDINGACFIAGELGEVEERRTNRVVLINNPKQTAARPYEEVAFTAEEGAWFIDRNFLHVKTATPVRTDNEAARIAFLRYLGVRSGLISDQFDPANFNVTYNEAVKIDYAGADYPVAAAVITAYPRAAHTPHHNVRAAVAAVLTRAVRDELRENFANIVCCVAYMFRVRGHHWLADMDAKYSALWRRCLKGSDNPGLSWELVAHDALHAIIPSVLDNFWVDKANHSNIAGALVKRISSAPAGVAGVIALASGMEDLANTVPGFKIIHKEQYAELDRLVKLLEQNRWAGSINRRFYGAQDLGFMEGRFAGIASTIMAALEQFAPSSQLKNSKALARMAAAAPISGGFTARLIAAAANDVDNARALVLARDTTA